MSSSNAPTPRDVSGLPPSGPASSYYASHGLVFRRLESGDELVAEVYGADASRGDAYEASGNSRAEHIARLLNDNPFPTGADRRCDECKRPIHAPGGRLITHLFPGTNTECRGSGKTVEDSQLQDCAHCPHKARYHDNKGLTPGGKCDPWHTGERCNCPGFEAA